MRLILLKTLKENFGIKVFAAFALFIFAVSFSFTFFFIHHQGKSLRDTLIKNGTLLARILARNSRIGVFSENEELLKGPVEGIFQQEGVLEVSVFNPEGELLARREGPEIRAPGKSVKGEGVSRNRISEKIRESSSPSYLEGDRRVQFWSPVMSGAGYPSEESLFFEESPHQRKDSIIGFVRITVDKGMLNKRLNDLLFKSILIGVIFLVIGSGVTYLVVKGITRPLNKLTKAVKTLGMEGVVQKVPVETRDEIGRLARAFNNMSEALNKRETEKERLEEQLRHAQKMEAVGTLAGGIAHDFNNILTAIIGYGGLLQMQIDKDEPSWHYVKQILGSAEKAANLTRHLLAFSRKHLIELKPVNLNESIKSVERLLKRLIREDIEIKVNLARENLIVMADSGLIEQALMNLATNARDAMPGGGVLTIATESVELDREFFKASNYERPGRYALLSVMDTGMGMDEKTRERIFDPFFTTKEVGMGTGLGLSMVYGIIKQHEGYIDVSSKPGKGTTFSIYLRLIDSKIEEKRSKTLGPPEGGTETVLIAEDEESVRMLAKEILERYGYNVLEATDGEDAVRKFMKNKEKIQIILLDVVMPKKNGKEVYEEIVRVRPGIKALFISGYTSDIIHKQGIIDEGISFISKPISPEVLLGKVREVLDK